MIDDEGFLVPLNETRIAHAQGKAHANDNKKIAPVLHGSLVIGTRFKFNTLGLITR